jgi:hypothetical protein
MPIHSAASRAGSAQLTRTVVSACINAACRPDFAVSTITVPSSGPNPEFPFDTLEADLRERGYECPFVHFDETEAPSFLIRAVRRYLILSQNRGANVDVLT